MLRFILSLLMTTCVTLAQPYTVMCKSVAVEHMKDWGPWSVVDDTTIYAELRVSYGDPTKLVIWREGQQGDVYVNSMPDTYGPGDYCFANKEGDVIHVQGSLLGLTVSPRVGEDDHMSVEFRCNVGVGGAWTINLKGK